MNVFQKTAELFERVILEDWVNGDIDAWVSGSIELDSDENAAYFYIRVARIAGLIANMNRDIQQIIRHGDYKTGTHVLGIHLATHFPASIIPTTWLQNLYQSITIACISLLTLFIILIILYNAWLLKLNWMNEIELWKNIHVTPMIILVALLALIINVYIYQKIIIENYRDVITKCTGPNNEPMRAFDRMLALFSISTTSERSQSGGNNIADEMAIYQTEISTTKNEKLNIQKHQIDDPKIAAIKLMAAIYRKYNDSRIWPRPIASGSRHDDGSNWPTTARENPAAARYIAETMQLLKKHGPYIVTTFRRLANGNDEEYGDQEVQLLDSICRITWREKKIDAYDTSLRHSQNVLLILTITLSLIWIAIPALEMINNALKEGKVMEIVSFVFFKAAVLVIFYTIISNQKNYEGEGYVT